MKGKETLAALEAVTFYPVRVKHVPGSMLEGIWGGNSGTITCPPGTRAMNLPFSMV